MISFTSSEPRNVLASSVLSKVAHEQGICIPTVVYMCVHMCTCVCMCVWWIHKRARYCLELVVLHKGGYTHEGYKDEQGMVGYTHEGDNEGMVGYTQGGYNMWVT